MVFKIVLLCATAILSQTISAQIIANAAAPCNGISLAQLAPNIGLAGNSLGLAGNGLGLAGLGSNWGANANLNNGGGFAVTSTSPITPSGISVLAENLLIEGPLSVGGNLPLLATVGLEGQVPATGSASTTYSCGNGNVGITSQLGAASNYGSGLGSGSGVPNYAAGIGAGAAGINYGALGANCGANRVY